MTNVSSKADWYTAQIARCEREITFAKVHGYSDRIPVLEREMEIAKALIDCDRIAASIEQLRVETEGKLQKLLEAARGHEAIAKARRVRRWEAQVRRRRLAMDDADQKAFRKAVGLREALHKASAARKLPAWRNLDWRDRRNIEECALRCRAELAKIEREFPRVAKRFAKIHKDSLEAAERLRMGGIERANAEVRRRLSDRAVNRAR